MLVLSRRTGQEIVLRHPLVGEIVIGIGGIDRGKDRVSIGIKAPPEVAILRGEIASDAAPKVAR